MFNDVIFAYKKGYRITEQGNILNPNGEIINGRIMGKYKAVSLRRNKNTTFSIHIHRLQAFQKYGIEMFKKDIEVRHFNGDYMDNTYENILIGTKSENQMDIPEAIRLSRAVYASSFIKKHNHEEIKKWHLKNNSSYKKTMENFSISSKGTLHFILNKQNPY